MREGIGSLPEDISPEEFIHLSAEPLDIEVPAPTPLMLPDAQNAMRKTLCAKRYARAAQPGGRGACATVGVGSVAKVGDQWKLGERSSGYLAFAGRPLMACARITADWIVAAFLLDSGGSHERHRERPEIVNGALRDLWE
jgi:hypothetical protein